MFSRLTLATFPFLMPLQQTSVSKRRQPVALLHVATLDRRQTIRCPDLGGGAGGATAKALGCSGRWLGLCACDAVPHTRSPPLQFSWQYWIRVISTHGEKGLGGRPADFCCLRRCGGQHEDHWGCGVVCGWWTAHVNTSFEEPATESSPVCDSNCLQQRNNIRFRTRKFMNRDTAGRGSLSRPLGSSSWLFASPLSSPSPKLDSVVQFWPSPVSWLGWFSTSLKPFRISSLDCFRRPKFPTPSTDP
jgi:hypothetical protein